MNASHSVFESLLGDDVLLEGVVASDEGSLWRRLSQTAGVQDVARYLGSDAERIRALCEFVDRLVAEPHDAALCHPRNMAICAALIVLEASPEPQVRHLFARLRRTTDPSMIWVHRIAESCCERFTETTRCRFEYRAPKDMNITDSVRITSGQTIAQTNGLAANTKGSGATWRFVERGLDTAFRAVA